ncbi:transmembrane protein 106B-like [Pholidichthys leucotaenia]
MGRDQLVEHVAYSSSRVRLLTHAGEVTLLAAIELAQQHEAAENLTKNPGDMEALPRNDKQWEALALDLDNGSEDEYAAIVKIRLQHLKKKLQANKRFHEHYVAFMEEIIAKGMGAVPSMCDIASGAEGLQKSGHDNDSQPVFDRDDWKRRNSSRRCSSADTVHCPTCQGTGRIPRGQESKLLAVIPCSDRRLKPRRTKLYVAVSVSICLLVCTLVIFFLFPRSVLLSPVAVKSSLVHFTEKNVHINITSVLNITNNNFAAVQAYNLTVQALNFDTVVGTVSIKNVAYINPLSIKMFSFVIPIKLTDPGLSNYCKKILLPVRILYLHLQMSLTVYYLAHYEHLSLETFEYIDCGTNSTRTHSMYLMAT